jgi:hypothetical protein
LAEQDLTIVSVGDQQAGVRTQVRELRGLATTPS